MTVPYEVPRFSRHELKARVLESVSTTFGVPIDKIRSTSRYRSIVRARAAAATLLRDMSSRSIQGKYSYPEIGRALRSDGEEFDHTTMINVIDKASRALRGESSSRTFENDFVNLYKIAEERSQLPRKVREALPEEVGFPKE